MEAWKCCARILSTTFHTSLKRRLHRTIKSVIITVSNEGNALTEESARHIFDKFYQADKSRAASGYGLGLAIAKQIIELHGGTITAKGIENSKIVFHIEIPSVA